MTNPSVDQSRNYTGLIQRLVNMSVSDVSMAVLFIGLVLYGAFGSPTPDRFGAVEGIVGACLVIGVGRSAVQALSFKAIHGWQGVGVFLLIYGLSVPVIGGVVNGAFAGDMARDVLPFLFMMIAVLIGARFETTPESFKVLALGTCLIGLLFSLRSLGMFGQNDELFYLANMPSVLFAAFVAAGLALQIFVERFSVRALLVVLALSLLGAIAMMPMIEAQQRASLGIFALLFISLCGFLFVQSPQRLVVSVLALCVALYPFFGELSDVVERLSQKTDLVGVNMRFEELKAVWAAVSDNPFTVAFGLGWGGSFSSPAVADIRVGFTHSLLTGMLLKTGIFGVALTGVYIAGLIRLLFKVHGHLVFVLALAGPIFIDVFLYASYKSLDFGLMLMLIPALYSYARFSSVEKAQIVERDEALV